jgi:hypothetical protein
MEETFWKKCSSCKKAIPFNAKYFVCSVSTCTGLRTGYSFCSVDCWEVHVPGARHRDAGALERKSPGSGSFSNPTSSPTKPAIAPPESGVRRVVVATPSASVANKPAQASSSIPRDVLIVASKLKD